MSVKSQEATMWKLAALLGRDLRNVCGSRECGPDEAKKAFLSLGKAFLRTLAKDLGLQNVRVLSNPGGIAVSGQCRFRGVWVDSGIFISMEQPCLGDDVFLDRTVHSTTGHMDSCSRCLRLRDLEQLSYERVLQILSDLTPAESALVSAA